MPTHAAPDTPTTMGPLSVVPNREREGRTPHAVGPNLRQMIEGCQTVADGQAAIDEVAARLPGPLDDPEAEDDDPAASREE